jgi:uncharacterized membrane protein HdeD (DUF308 family)
MRSLFQQAWWALALRGVAGIAFGVLALLWPGITLLTLVALFAAYALITGIAAVIGAVRNRRADEDWWLMLLVGLVGIGAGIISLIQPALSGLVLVLLIGANALVTGVLDIVAAIRLRKAIKGEWLLALNGIAAVVFGVLAFLFPAAGAVALVWMISAYAIVTGALLLTLAFRVRALEKGGISRPEVERRHMPDRRTVPVH